MMEYPQITQEYDGTEITVTFQGDKLTVSWDADTPWVINGIGYRGMITVVESPGPMGVRIESVYVHRCGEKFPAKPPTAAASQRIYEVVKMIATDWINGEFDGLRREGEQRKLMANIEWKMRKVEEAKAEYDEAVGELITFMKDNGNPVGESVPTTYPMVHWVSN